MNLSDLRRAAQHADMVRGSPRTRLTAVHLRIRTARRRRTAAVVGTVAVAVVLGGAALNGTRQGPLEPSPAGSSISATDPAASWWCTAAATPPPEGRVGFVGLPPEGAVPGSTTGAPLVLHWFGPDGFGKGDVWLFADGRLIVEREANVPQGANNRQSGYLERCLTPSGVEAMRRYVIEQARPLTTSPPFAAWLRARATADGALLEFSYSSVVGDRLLEPESWLRESDWADKRYRPYVPTTYSFCMLGLATPPGAGLDLLPDGARDLLDGRTWFAHPLPGAMTCTTLGLAEARHLLHSLEQTWFRSDYAGPGFTLDIGLVTRRTANVTEAEMAQAYHASIEPVLPNGELTCNCG